MCLHFIFPPYFTFFFFLSPLLCLGTTKKNMEFEFQQQLQQPYFASFPPSSTSSSSTYAIPPPPFIEPDATPRRKPFIPNKVTLTELQQYQEQQQLQVQHHPAFPSYSAYPPDFQYLYQQAQLINDTQSLPSQYSQYQPQPPPLPLQNYDMDIDTSVYAPQLKQKPSSPSRKTSNGLGFSPPPISAPVAPVYGSPPSFFSPTTQSFGDMYIQANPHLGQANVNVDPRQHHHRHSYTYSQDNFFNYTEPIQHSKPASKSRSSRRSKSQYYEDPSTPVLTVTPRKKRPKSLAAQDFAIGDDGLGYSRKYKLSCLSIGDQKRGSSIVFVIEAKQRKKKQLWHSVHFLCRSRRGLSVCHLAWRRGVSVVRGLYSGSRTGAGHPLGDSI